MVELRCAYSTLLADLFVGAAPVATLFAVIPNARAVRSGTCFCRHPREGGDPCRERFHIIEILR